MISQAFWTGRPGYLERGSRDRSLHRTPWMLRESSLAGATQRQRSGSLTVHHPLGPAGMLGWGRQCHPGNKALLPSRTGAKTPSGPTCCIPAKGGPGARPAHSVAPQQSPQLLGGGLALGRGKSCFSCPHPPSLVKLRFLCFSKPCGEARPGFRSSLPWGGWSPSC